MDIAAIDRSATRDDGFLRAASPASKLVALALVLAAVLASFNVLVLLGVFVGLLAIGLAGRLPMRLALTLAAYPALFAGVFAVASAPDAMTAAVIVMKAVCAALAAVTVVLSTPYPYIFAPIQRIVPGIVGDALLMTYRATFLLLGKFGALLRAVRLRAGARGRTPMRTLRLSASAMGGLLLYAVDLAQRDYDVMRLRGYAGRLRTSPRRSRDRRADAIVIVAAVLALTTAVLWRLGAASLNPYSWLVPIPAVMALAAIAASRPRKDPA